MPKFKVNCYYSYVGIAEVEADNEQEAFDKGYAICDKMGTEQLHFVGYTDAEVTDENGEIQTFN